MEVLAAARRAFDTVPFYRRLYRDRPAQHARRARDRPERLPSGRQRGRLRRRRRCGRRGGGAALPGLAPPAVLAGRGSRRGAGARAAPAGRPSTCWAVRRESARRRFLLLADDATGPLAARLSNSLAASGGSASILFHAADPDATGAQRSRRSIRTACSCWRPIRGSTISAPGRPCCGWSGSTAGGAATRRGDRLLFSDELHAIGAARAGEPFTLLLAGRAAVRDERIPAASCS